jgi:hypothetical protein
MASSDTANPAFLTGANWNENTPFGTALHPQLLAKIAH